MTHALFSSLVQPAGASIPAPGPTIQRSGSIDSEVWENQTVEITGDLRVKSSADLLINPGTNVVFKGNFWIEVRGGLKIKGTAGQRVTVAPDTGVPSWYGIIIGADLGDFDWGTAKAGKSFEFEFCDFIKGKKHTRDTIADRHHLRGGAIGANDPDAFSVTDCTFTDCDSIESGGAVYINGHASNRTFSFANSTFTNCLADFGDNNQYSTGGGLKVDHGTSFSITNCTFVNCTAGSAYENVPGITVNTSTDTLTTPVAHEMTTGSSIRLAGSPPAPLVAGQEYYAIVTGSSTLKVASTIANANSGTAINLTSSGGSFTGTIQYDFYGFDNSYTRT